MVFLFKYLLRGFITNGGLAVLIFTLCIFQLSSRGRKYWYDRVMKIRASIENRPERIDSINYYVGGDQLINNRLER